MDYAFALQRQINSGFIWRMQGRVGRAAMDALKRGSVMLGKTRSHDYYGLAIPSRSDVKSGTTGSYKLVEDVNGPKYAKALAKLP